MQSPSTHNTAASAKAELQRLLTTPQSPHMNPATVAHSALERLRDAGDEHYLFLRTLLELLHSQQQSTATANTTSDDELLAFHCVTGVRHVLLHGWRRFATIFKAAVRDWMMVVGHLYGQRHQKTLQVACYTTSVALWKRSWLELVVQQPQQQLQHQDAPTDSAQQTLLQSMTQTPANLLAQVMGQQQATLPFLASPLQLFQYLEASILDPNNTNALSSTQYLQALVDEFSGTKSAVTYQLPLEFHRQTRQAFESSGSNSLGLGASLQLAMKCLSLLLPQLQQQKQAQPQYQPMAQIMMQIVSDCLNWEFGMDAFEAMGGYSSSGLVRPPKEWESFHITSTQFLQTLWQTHSQLRLHNHPFCHTLRQLLLTLASLEGSIFITPQTRKDFLAALLQGTLELLQALVTAIPSGAALQESHQWTELLDTLGILARLVANGKWSLLIQFHKDPLLPGLLHGLRAIGQTLWEQHVQDAMACQGDLEAMEFGDDRERTLQELLETVVAVTGDPWLWYSGPSAEKQWARQAVGEALGPLYGIWAQGRMQLAGWEEHYLTRNAADLEADYEHISEVQLQEEMESLSTLGRIHIQGAIQSLSSLFQQTVPQLQAQWNAPLPASGEVTPDLAAMLEQARVLTLYIGHLLTDDNKGETPVIPDVVAIACREQQDDNNDIIPIIVSAMEALFSLAQTQAMQLAKQPNDPRLSPLLGSSFLWCFNRWAPAYIYSVDYNNSSGESSSARNIGAVWSSPEKAQQAISFAITLCLHFQCYWPQERPLQEGTATLLLSLAKRAAGFDDQHHPSKIRTLMVASPSFTQMMLFHCLTAGTRHSMSRPELEQTIHAKANDRALQASMDIAMVTGYQRLPYDIKSQILTALLVACSEEVTESLWKDCLKAVQDAFSSLLHALSTKQVQINDINAKEMTCLCVEMFRGAARASEMANPSRIPIFVTPNLSHLSGLMQYYAEDLTICERLLQFFRDYTEQFVIMLNPDQCLALFQASAELLKSYSTHHCNCKTRVIVAKSTQEANSEEEQKYSDVLCAIQLLIHLGTKDFIDICSSDPGSPGVDSTQVTDVIFFGLQQLLPLMTQGLLQMPTLCTQYFSLAGFTMETYPEKVAVLPYELFDALMESLLFGMCHHDPTVAKSSLQGIASILREHLKSNILSTHLSNNPGLIDGCSRRLVRDVVFQNKVWDRLESTGLALLPLAAIDVSRFAAVVKELISQVPAEEQKARLQKGFESLLQPEVLQKVSSGGTEGRKNRIRFKKDFENFCHDIHSFLMLK